MAYLCLSFFPWNQPEKTYAFTIINKKDLKFYIICGILHKKYLKMRVKKMNFFKDIKLENLNSIETLFSIYKHLIFHLCPYKARFFKIVLSWRMRHNRKLILKGRGFQGGSDEKMRRLWLGGEIVVVGLPPLV